MRYSTHLVGKTAQRGDGRTNKEDLHGSDIFLQDAMDHYISSAKANDVAILISGNLDDKHVCIQQ